MNTGYHFQPVSPDNIDFEDRTYALIPWEEAPGKLLISSIRQFGILHPPVLREKENNSYKIVTGRKRLIAAQLLTPDASVPCIITPAVFAEKDVFELIVGDALTGSTLSLFEQIELLSKLLQASSVAETLPMLERLGRKPQGHILNDLLKLRTLGQPALQALHRGTLSEKNARKLHNLPEKDQELVVMLITDFQFGGSKQQKLVDLCLELVMRQELPLETILAEFSTEREKKQPGNSPQHGAELLSRLQQRCFPRSSVAEQAFRKESARLHLPPCMSIGHAPAFENAEVTLSIRFESLQSLSRVIEGIKKLVPDA